MVDRPNRYSRFSRRDRAARRPVMQFVAAFALIIASSLATLRAQSTELTADQIQEQIETIVLRYSERTLDDVWIGSRNLEELGDEVIPWAQTALTSDKPFVVLMASKTLISLGEVKGVDRALAEIGSNDQLEVPVRVAAIEMIGEFDTGRTKRLLNEILDSTDAFLPRLRVAAASSLFRATSDYRKSRDSLIPLLEVDDPQVRALEAITLAEVGAMDGKIRNILRVLEKEPTDLGARARLVLSQDFLMRRIERLRERGDTGGTSASPQLTKRLSSLERELELRNRRLETTERQLEELRESFGQKKFSHPLLGDVLDLVDRFYVDPDVVDRNRLIVEAVKGMVSSLDRFSSFMDVKETKSFQEGISGEYAGIGAAVSKDQETGFMRILRPIYGGPAHRAGLLTDDQIVEVEGVSTKPLTLNDLIKKLKGAPRTTVTMKIARRGWIKPREFKLVRETIEIASVQSTLLPGSIGYLSLTQFGKKAVTETDAALDSLLKQGMKALILDLRNNPGGYLEAAVRIVDEFVDAPKDPIVTQRDEGRRTEAERRFATPGSRGDFPLVVLINEGSASASEIVSGALQDFKRAKVVGERSYGKGSVQKLFALSEGTNQLLGGESTLRLTVQYYYLPSGRSIHTRYDMEGRVISEGGVQPDIVVENSQRSLGALEAISELTDKNAFKEYLEKFLEPNRELLARLAENGDGGDPGAYPELKKFFAKYESAASIDDIRWWLRRKLRRIFEDQRGAEFACDYAEDAQLQRAILEQLQALGLNREDFPDYQKFAK